MERRKVKKVSVVGEGGGRQEEDVGLPGRWKLGSCGGSGRVGQGGGHLPLLKDMEATRPLDERRRRTTARPGRLLSGKAEGW